MKIHMEIRQVICDFISDPTNWNTFAPHCIPFTSGREYVNNPKHPMRGDCVWATDVELNATALMTEKNVHVCVYNNALRNQIWTVYRASGLSERPFDHPFIHSKLFFSF